MPVGKTMWLVVVVLAVAAAACGSDGGLADESEIPATTTTIAPATSGASSTTVAEPDDGAEPSADATWFFDQFEVGDCWDDIYDEDGEIVRTGEARIIPCDEPHFYEVYAIFEAEGGDQFPGDDDLIDQANEECGLAWTAYIGTAYQDTPALDGFAPKPSAEEWSAGVRDVVCVANYDYGRVDRSFEGLGAADPLPYDMPDDAPVPAGALVWAVGDTEDGDRLASFGVEMPQDEAVAEIALQAGAAGWTVVSRTAASRSVVLVLDDGETEYTVVVVAAEEDPEDLDIAFYYPPGPLSTYPEG